MLLIELETGMDSVVEVNEPPEGAVGLGIIVELVRGKGGIDTDIPDDSVGRPVPEVDS